MNHTPGPWTFDPQLTNFTARITARNGMSTVCSGIGMRPDADLIAAAPDLLEACRKVLDWLTHLEQSLDEGDNLRRMREQYHRRYTTALTAAIEKAEGVK